jgi:hypothetical protein
VHLVRHLSVVCVESAIIEEKFDTITQRVGLFILRVRLPICAAIKAYLFSGEDPANRFTNASSSRGLRTKVRLV